MPGEIRALAKLVAPLLYIVGDGPLLTAMTAVSYIKEMQGAEMRWDKTEKTGQLEGGPVTRDRPRRDRSRRESDFRRTEPQPPSAALS